ncbi:hypothetical protein NIIDMKKI_23910 [Mycobacterium kansasii]|uniref:Uncharacterized protein n=1 Tax=Mycobacterium kansasii TaxID=1768 RepID=A0A7G1IBS9_MYCKA|nr:hypothetical protein NIIDMKKI_23910 [Mycobacterium kansasii]
MDPIPIALAGFDGRQVGVPDKGVDLGQGDPGLGAVGVEQTQLDPLGDLAEQREIRAGAVVRRAQRVGPAGPNLESGRGGDDGSAGHGAIDTPSVPRPNPAQVIPVGFGRRQPDTKRLAGKRFRGAPS